MPNGSPPRKIDRLRALMAAGLWNEALSLAAKWAHLGPQAGAIRTGHDATAHPDFYRQLRKDPDQLRQAGIDALRERYGDPSD